MSLLSFIMTGHILPQPYLHFLDIFLKHLSSSCSHQQLLVISEIVFDEGKAGCGQINIIQFSSFVSRWRKRLEKQMHVGGFKSQQSQQLLTGPP